MHARMMIEGFMGAFIVGLLGTIGPRVTLTSPLSARELWTLLILYAAAVGTHIAERYSVADAIFLALLLTFSVMMAQRVRRRSALPPASFVLIGIGFIQAILGAVLLLLHSAGATIVSGSLLGGLLLYQGFILCLTLGIAGSLRSGSVIREAAESTTAWTRRARFSAAIGIVLFASFVVEGSAGSPRIAGVIRVIAALIFLVAQEPLDPSTATRGAIHHSLRLGFIAVILGLLFPLLWPWQRIGGLHFAFLGGFSLVAFALATHLVLEQAGDSDWISARLRLLRHAIVLLGIAALLRVMGDFLPAVRGTLLSIASYVWMIAAGIWGWRTLSRIPPAHSQRPSAE